MFTCMFTCDDIHSGRIGPASLIELTTVMCGRTRDFHPVLSPSCVDEDSRFEVAHVFSWSPVRLRHVRGGVGKRRSLISSPSGRFTAEPSFADIRSSTVGTQSLHLTDAGDDVLVEEGGSVREKSRTLGHCPFHWLPPSSAPC